VPSGVPTLGTAISVANEPRSVSRVAGCTPSGSLSVRGVLTSKESNRCRSPERVGAALVVRQNGRVPRTLAVANQKGGVAKTTTVATLGAALSELGQRVLVVDLDPQACLTFSVGIDPEDLDKSIHQVLLGGVRAGDVLIEFDDGPDLLPATIELATAEVQLARGSSPELVLRAALLPLLAAYDWIIVDCPPTLGLLTVNGLSAASDVLIPLQCETLAHRGVGQLLDTIYDVQQLTSPGLRVLGVLPTSYDGRTTHARTVLETIAGTYSLQVLRPAIPKSIRFAEAPAVGATVLRTAPASPGAKAYRELAGALLH
jgi:chromosome partitioning protein